MKVKAVAMGYYGHVRIRPGDVFEMDEQEMKQKDGKPVLPTWVVSAETVVKDKKLNLPGAKQVKPSKVGVPVITSVDQKGKGKDQSEEASTGDFDVI